MLRRIPHVHAMGMLLTGRRIPAAEAHALGLVNEVAAPDELDAAVDRWLEGVLACPPLSVRAVKAMVPPARDVCPVECIYEGGRMMYIHPTECISCGLCLSICPVDAIFADDELPEHERRFLDINAEFFGDEVTGWGEPGGATEKFTTDLDHDYVAATTRKEAITS